MLLTLTHRSPSPADAPASDLGFLLHKHPDRVRTVTQSFGRAHVFWPEAGDEVATVALLVEVDSVGLAKRRPHRLLHELRLAPARR